MPEIVRPDFVKDEHLDYLDELRESGVTNMFGASAYLERDFDLASHTARKVLVYWMETFSERMELKARAIVKLGDISAEAVFEAVSEMKSEDTSFLEGEKRMKTGMMMMMRRR